jgi:transcriptional regulator with XRE-family HTH domain
MVQMPPREDGRGGSKRSLMETAEIQALVKRLRDRMGLTQEQFAREVGVTFSTVNLWENGHRRPQPYLMKRLLEMEASLEQGAAEAGKKPGRKPKRER